MAQPANILELMRELLGSMDITDYEPAVPHMLVELFYRHVTDVLQGAQGLCAHRNSKEIGEDDLAHAIKVVTKQSMLHPPSLETVRASARKVNERVLPPIPDVPEVVLPSSETSLMEPNFWTGAAAPARPT